MLVSPSSSAPSNSKTNDAAPHQPERTVTGGDHLSRGSVGGSVSDELTDALAQLEQVLAAGDGPVHLPTNLGLTRMADACGIPYDVLAWTAEWYVREETLRGEPGDHQLPPEDAPGPHLRRRYRQRGPPLTGFDPIRVKVQLGLDAHHAGLAHSGGTVAAQPPGRGRRRMGPDFVLVVGEMAGVAVPTLRAHPGSEHLR
jgi:hypothetical protein